MATLEVGPLHRIIICIFVYITTVSPLPQDTENITYVKIDPLTRENEDISNERAAPTDETVALEIPGILENEFNRHIDNFDITTEDYQSETTTEIYEVTTKRVERTSTRPSYRSNPRFISKLSYFNNANSVDIPTNNFVEKFAKRKYKSKCRCEKIWNCPKLQISVPRCPNEYFMCCF